MAVDLKCFPSWSPFVYVNDNPLRLFDPDGLSGRDISRFVYGARRYYYHWGGKAPNDQLIAKFDDASLKYISLTERDYVNEVGKENWRPTPGMCIGYDCSGLIVAANNQNPDRSYDLGMEGTRTISELKTFFESHPSAYSTITRGSDLQEGDFVLSADGSHGGLVVRDPETGELQIGEAPRAGRKVSTNQSYDKMVEKVDSGRYIGYRDNASNPRASQVRLARDLPKWWRDLRHSQSTDIVAAPQ